MAKKIVDPWSSPKEYQSNTIPRGKKMRLKPKSYCTKLKGKHQYNQEVSRIEIGWVRWVRSKPKSTLYLVEKLCVCGSKKREILNDIDL